MKKINNKGFMLVETLVVTTFVFSTLIYIYVQFRTINNSYDKTFSYNTVNSIYATNSIKKYVIDIGFYDMIMALKNEDYVDLTECPVEYITEVTYCETLFNKINVKKVIFTKQNLGDLKQYLTQNRPFDDDFMNFINYVKYDDSINEYRLIVAYGDNSFASLKIF